jgi:hypothetical protein
MLEERFLMAEVEGIHSVNRPMQTLHQTLTPEQRYILDRGFIICGAASAGAVLANVLSADPANRVSLLRLQAACLPTKTLRRRTRSPNPAASPARTGQSMTPPRGGIL